MSAKIEYYFSMVSPWAFIGHAPFHDLVQEHGVEVTYKPVALLEVFEQTGGLPLAKRHPARLKLRWQELQRWREKRNMDFHLQPAHWPFEFSLADRLVIATIKTGQNPATLMAAMWRAIWQEQKNLADETELETTADTSGLQGVVLLNSAKSDEVATTYAQNTKDALAANVFGAPTFILNGENFWGQDRLDMLRETVASGRQPYPAST